jgi:hypothetical protein
VPSSREELGRLVRAVWMEWAAGQPDPKPSWLTEWDDLDEGQREVDMRIGETVAAVARAAERESDLMPTLSGVYTRPVQYHVSVWTDAQRLAPATAMDAWTWCVTVAGRGHDRWAVIRGGDGALRDNRNPAVCLSAAGAWEWERIPSDRTDDWLKLHRFSLADALALAREHAPRVTISGMTAAEVLERHRA